MTKHIQSATGVIEAIFVHRFVLRQRDGSRLLADLGPKGLDVFALSEGAAVTVEGEQKPSELKVATITPEGGKPIAIAHGSLDDEGDAKDAVAAVERAGMTPIGKPHRKPKHFEVLACRGKDLFEVHVEFAGDIRKEKPVEATSEKWADEIAAAS